DAAVAARIGADAAGRARIDIAADLAHPHRLDRTIERRGQRDHQLVLLLDELQHGTPRRARPQPRQAREKLDQLLDLGSGGHQETPAGVAPPHPPRFAWSPLPIKGREIPTDASAPASPSPLWGGGTGAAGGWGWAANTKATTTRTAVSCRAAVAGPASARPSSAASSAQPWSWPHCAR